MEDIYCFSWGPGTQLRKNMVIICYFLISLSSSRTGQTYVYVIRKLVKQRLVIIILGERFEGKQPAGKCAKGRV